MYIHQRENWSNFSWDNERILPILASVRHLQGRLLGHMERLGFDLIERATLESLILDVVDTSRIEGEFLNPDLVRLEAQWQLDETIFTFAGTRMPKLFRHEGCQSGREVLFLMQLVDG